MSEIRFCARKAFLQRLGKSRHWDHAPVCFLPGTPIKSITYANKQKHVASVLQSNNYKHFQRFPFSPGGSMQHECNMGHLAAPPLLEVVAHRKIRVGMPGKVR